MKGYFLWQPLAEVYIAEESDYSDWDKHTYCLCSKISLRTPSFFNQPLLSIKGCEQELFNVLTENDFGKEDNSSKDLIFRREISIKELETTVSLYVSRYKIEPIVTKNSILQCVSKQSLCNGLTSFYVYLKTDSNFLSSTALKLLYPLLAVTYRNLILDTFQYKTWNRRLTFSLLQNQSFSDLVDCRTLRNFDSNLSLYEFSFIRHFLQVQWEQFWLENGAYLSSLTWTTKYAKYLDPEYVKNFECLLGNLSINDTGAQETEIYSPEQWQILWHNHYAAEYNKYYGAFMTYLVKHLNRFSETRRLKQILKPLLSYIGLFLIKLSNKFYQKVLRFITMEKTVKNEVIDEPSVKKDSIDRIEDALYNMGYFSESKALECNLKGQVVSVKSTGKRQNKFIKKRGLYISKLMDSLKPNEHEFSNEGTKPENVFNEEAEISIEEESLNECMKSDQAENHEKQNVSVNEEPLNEILKPKRKPYSKKKRNLPEQIRNHPELWKYWAKRYRLFSKFDEGIKLDHESWFSVSPEKVAEYTARRCRCDTLIDAFCGAGGNSIRFANTCERVIAIDIDPEKIELAKHNAKIYGVEDRIEFIVADFFSIADRLIGDVIFLSPPWGGPSYVKTETYDLKNILHPIGGIKLFEAARRVTENIAYYLPRNVNTLQLPVLAGPGCAVEVEQNFLDNRLIAVTAYFGELIKKA